MDKLKSTANGGFPIVLDDLRFEQKAVRDGLLGLLAGFCVTPGDSFVISGCKLVAGNWLPGWINLGGEICKFDGLPFVAAPTGYTNCFDVVVTYDATGNKVMQDTSTTQAYEVRKATVVAIDNSLVSSYMVAYSDASPNILQTLIAKYGADVMSLNMLKDLIVPAPVIFQVGRGLTNVGGTGLDDAAYGPNTQEASPALPLRYWKDSLGYVNIQGNLKANATSSNEIIFQLPIGFRLISDDMLRFWAFDESTGAFVFVSVVKSSNYVFINNCTSGHQYNIGSLRFRP